MTEPLPVPVTDQDPVLPSTGDLPPALPVPAAVDRPRALREPEGAWVAGVSTGIAAHLNWPVTLVRVGFVALASMQLIGVFVYGLLWMLMPPAAPAVEAPGLESAKRRGMRRKGDGSPRRAGAASVVLVVVGGAATLANLRSGSTSSGLFWPMLLAAVGLAIVWRQADVPRTEPVEVPHGRLARLTSGVGWGTVLRVAVGVGLVGVSVTMVALSQIGVAQLPLMLGLAALMVLGVGIAAAPWLAHMRRNQQAAHERAVVDQARADMAAHLHDSVLQTLALIQRQADDPKAVASLARRQERELRAWLYGDEVTDQSLKAALTRAAAEIEDERGIDVELVCVGDVDLDERTTALVRAAREAMMNAAKHSGAPRVDVYCEVEPGRVEAFVRDRGAGFDLEAIGDDRMGVRRSIIERMERHGGTARIRSTPGEGTEIALVMET